MGCRQSKGQVIQQRCNSINSGTKGSGKDDDGTAKPKEMSNTEMVKHVTDVKIDQKQVTWKKTKLPAVAEEVEEDATSSEDEHYYSADEDLNKATKDH
ncbi:hypothetical protein SLEP1_g49208 [Rubroshorea leprosula]|uniref:Uncharacterized protein n=1 Tax=Rubroshorea leprosula TaxID=152421 RepID=A0AAV5LW89_9ROSI|nr:hypothetical protein SLEP1_g49208 [Rubroshorea leprosula]